MSYTPSDALQNIFDNIKSGLGLSSVKDELLRYFEHQNGNPSLYGDYDEEIKFLKGGLSE